MNFVLFLLCLIFIKTIYSSSPIKNEDNKNDEIYNIFQSSDIDADDVENENKIVQDENQANRKRKADSLSDLEKSNYQHQARGKTVEEMLAENPLEGTSRKYVNHLREFEKDDLNQSFSSPSSANYYYMRHKGNFIERKPLSVTKRIMAHLHRQESPEYNNTNTNFSEPGYVHPDIMRNSVEYNLPSYYFNNSYGYNLTEYSLYRRPDTPDSSEDNNNQENFERSPRGRKFAGGIHVAEYSTLSESQNKEEIKENFDNKNSVQNRVHTATSSIDRKMNMASNYKQRLHQRLEGSNPYELETTNAVDHEEEKSIDFSDSKCESVENVLADLVKHNFEIEKPLWRGYTFNTGSFNREELQIIEVVAEKKFYLNKQIKEWKSLGHQAIGLGSHGLSLITSHSDGLRVDNQDFDISISAMDMFNWWDPHEYNMKTGVLLVQETFIKWYKFHDDNRLTEIWSWTLTYPIIHVSIFTMDGNWKVAITHEQTGDYERAISIYGLELWKNWWYEQRLQGHEKPAIINNGRLMAVTLKNRETVLIYKYDYKLRRYFNFKNLTSPDIESLIAFNIGSHSFLALGGDSPIIYEIKGSEFDEKNVEHYKLEHVEQWLPVSLGYYRNDAIVLFQHKLDHYTHSSSILEALQWDGEKFFLLEHSPCRSHEEEMFGFSCILDAEGEKGIKGATSLKMFDDRICILTASEEYSPIMFEIKTELVEVLDPVQREMEEILIHKTQLEEKFISQQRILEQANKMINYAVNKEEDVIFADNWKIDKIIAPSVQIVGKMKNTLVEDGQVNVAGQDWRNVDFSMDTSQMFYQIRRDHDRIKSMVNDLKRATMKKDGLPDILDDVTISGNLIVHGKIHVDDAHVDFLNELHVDTVLENSVKKNKDGKLIIHGNIILDNLNADNIDVEYINGIKIDSTNKDLKNIAVDGDLHVFNHVHVLKDVVLNEHGTINNINFKTDIYTSNQGSDDDKFYQLNFDSITVKDKLKVSNTLNGYDFTNDGFKKLLDESRIHDRSLLRDELVLEKLSIGKNMHFDNINGLNWNNFMDNIVMKSENIILKDLNVNGNIKVDKNIKMTTLNNLAYPHDYFLLNEKSSSVFTAPKTFVDVLEVDEIDCEGSINGIKPEDIVTLSSRQHLDNFTFFDLTVTEKLNVQGNITGKELDAFLSNPKLTESNDIKSNVIFKNLKVNGTVRVENKINGTKWENLFKNVIMKTDQAINIDSLKSFEGEINVKNDLNIRSGFINNRRVADFLTVDSDQMIANENLYGNIIFEELDVEGMFDDVNVTHLGDNVVSLSEDQALESNMIFDVDDDLDYSYDEDVESRTSPLSVSNLIVNKHCNNWVVPDDVLFNDDQVLKLNSSQFDILYVNHLIIEGNLINFNTINNINLKEFDKIRLSKTYPKNILSPYVIKNCTMESVNFKTLNGISRYEIDTFTEKLENIENMITTGNINIGNLYVAGKLDIGKINDIDLRQIAENAIWLKDDNHITGNLIFLDKMNMKNLQLKQYAHNVIFNEFINDIVQIYNDPIKLIGMKTYLNGLNILKNITTDYINDIKFDNILIMKGNQNIEGNLHVNGNLAIVKNLQVLGTLNEISIEEISNSFKYMGNNEYLLKGDFYLEKDAYIGNFVINGLVNDMYDLKHTLDSTINKFNDNYLENTIVFTKPVTIKNNLDIMEMYNDIEFQKLLDNVVFKDDNVNIDSNIIFKKPLKIQGNLYIKGNLSCDIIQYCSVEEWKSNAIFLDQATEITGTKSFKNLIIKGNIYTKFLNDIPFDNFLTLNTDQNITKGLNFETVNVKEAVSVAGYVNLKYLQKEFKNILMTEEAQDIISPMHFHSNVYVTNAFIDYINNKNAKKIVNLISDQTLEGTYNFYQNLTFVKNLNIFNLISDIDFNLWIKNAVHKNNFPYQIISGNWNVSGNVEFRDKIEGEILLNGLKMKEIDYYLRNKNESILSNEKFYQSKYNQLCYNIENSNDIIKKRMYLFKYFEEIQTIINLEVSSVHYFGYGDENFFILNNKWECRGNLWKWNKESRKFEKIKTVQTGCPIIWYTLKTKNSLFLLSLNDVECDCKVEGTTVWNFDGNNIKPIKSLKSVESINIAQEDDNNFYTIDNNKISKFTITKIKNIFEVTESYIYPKLDNAKFMPAKHNLLSALITDGNRIISLNKNLVIQMKNERLITADEIIEFVVGKKLKKFSAVVWSHEMKNDRTENTITIYEDVLEEVEFQRISSYKPSSLTIVQLENYQTLLMFIENKKQIQVYHYRGFVGFQHLYQLNIPAERIISVTLNDSDDENKGILIISDSTISIVQITMYGMHNTHTKNNCNF